jgi:Concanavalin A-like lectin/glucanases superfamily
VRGLSAAWLWFCLCLPACGDATARGAESLAEPGPRDASYDGALSFDGVDDYASLGTARAPHVKRDQTVMLWFRGEGARSGGGALQVLFTLHRSQDSGFALALEEDVPLAYKVYGDRELARATDAVSLGEWHHLAFVLEAEQSRLYLDGVEVAASTTELTNRTPTQAFLGSADGFDHPYHGALDELRVYERAFAPEELQAVAAGQPPSDAEPIVVYLPFDEAEGARAFDRSGLGNHAQLGDGVPQLMPARIRR